MPETSATIAAHSTWNNEEVITFELTFPRIILSQFNKYALVRSNTSSSRAVPVARSIAITEADPYIPFELYKNKPGMGGGERLEGEVLVQARQVIYDIYEYTASKVKELDILKVHKQHANRYLEAFTMVKVIATGARPAWDHIIKQRSDIETVQPEFVRLAEAIVAALTVSEAKHTNIHVPWCTGEPMLADIMYACGRAARTSYLREDVSGNFIERLKDFWDDGHLTPFEHVAINVPCSIVEDLVEVVAINPLTVAQLTFDRYWQRFDAHVTAADLEYADTAGAWQQLRHIGLDNLERYLQAARNMA